jgi:two-component system, LuxR family, response regulator FixJ
MNLNAPVVFVVDDEAAARESVGALVESHGYRAACFESAEEFLAKFDREAHGCLITDHRMLGASGMDMIRALNHEGGRMPVILITAYASVPLAVQAMELGAVTVLEKPCRDQELWQSIERALKLDAEVYTSRIRAAEVRRCVASLLDEELEVLRRIVRGQQNKAIAHELGIGLRTVEARRHAVFSKLQADSLAELLRKVIEAKALGEEQEVGPRLAEGT